MKDQRLLDRVVSHPDVCGAEACIRGTRIPIAVVLDSLAEGHDPERILKEYANLTMDDIRAALAYAGELAREAVWTVGSRE